METSSRRSAVTTPVCRAEGGNAKPLPGPRCESAPAAACAWKPGYSHAVTVSTGIRVSRSGWNAMKPGTDAPAPRDLIARYRESRTRPAGPLTSATADR